MRSSTTGFEESLRVSPVVVFLRPARATISPERASFRSSRELECMRSMRPTRSRLSLTVFLMVSPVSTTPE